MYMYMYMYVYVHTYVAIGESQNTSILKNTTKVTSNCSFCYRKGSGNITNSNTVGP